MAFLNIFRSIAILLIVFNHSLYPAGWEAIGLFKMILHNIVAGSTVMFVFISGYLFHQLSFDRFQYRPFMKSKFSTLLPAYIALSIIPIIARLMFTKGQGDIFTLTNDTWIEYIRVILAYLVYGHHMTGYWFVPIILLLYATAPFYIYFIKRETKYQLLVLSILLLIALLIYRPHHNIGVVQSYFYFLPVYLTGILCSLNADFIKKVLHGRHGWGFLIFLFLTVLQPLIYNDCGNMPKDAFVWHGFDLILIQKLVLAIVLVDFLHVHFDRSLWFFDLVATASFAIYLINPYVVSVLNLVNQRSVALQHVQWESVVFQGNVLLPPVYTGLILFFTLAAGVAVKLITRNRSKYFIGW